MVPVIHDVDKLSIFEIAAKVADSVKKEETGNLRLDDMKDGTFTITNYGALVEYLLSRYQLSTSRDTWRWKNIKNTCCKK